eukprot:9102073-Pyramimonas_sp.AAC.1
MGVLSRSLGVSGPSWAVLEAARGPLGPSWGHLGPRTVRRQDAPEPRGTRQASGESGIWDLGPLKTPQ